MRPWATVKEALSKEASHHCLIPIWNKSCDPGKDWSLRWGAHSTGDTRDSEVARAGYSATKEEELQCCSPTFRMEDEPFGHG